MIVFNTTGSSAFTDDPSRHHILEPATATSSGSMMIQYMLPNRDVSNFLAQSYFVNVCANNTYLLYFPLHYGQLANPATDQCSHRIV